MEHKSATGIRLISAILLVLYLSAAASADVIEPVKCSCKCDGVTIQAVGNTLRGRISDDERMVSLSQCSYSCGAICGGSTRLATGSDCSTNCTNEYCGDTSVMDCSSTPVGNTCISGCEASCERACDNNTSVYSLISTLQLALLAIAVVIFAISGLKFITSDEAKQRSEAKKGIVFVIMLFILIGIAKPLVYTFYSVGGVGPGVVPINISPLPTKDEVVGEIGEAIIMAWDATCVYKGYDDGECEGFTQSKGKETLYGKVDVSQLAGNEITEDDINDYLTSRQPPVRCIDDLLGTVSTWRDPWWRFTGFHLFQKSITSMNGEVCIIYRRTGNRIGVYQSSDNGICADFSDKVEQIGDAVAGCWDSYQNEEGDVPCELIPVSGWPPVEKGDVKNYLYSIGREKGGPGAAPALDFPMDWEAGDIPEDLGADSVCIWFDAGTGLFDSKEVFVSKESEENICVQELVHCEFPQVLDVEVLEA